MPPRVDLEANSACFFETELSPVDRAHGEEVSTLQKQLHELGVRLEEVELERDSNAAKAFGLQDLIRTFEQDRGDERVKTSSQVSELSEEMDTNENRIKRRQDNSGVRRVTSRDKIGMMEEHVGLTQITNDELDNLKVELKTVTADRETLSAKCRFQEDTIDKLTKDIEAKDRQIENLEEVLSSLNDERREEQEGMSSIKKKREKEDITDQCQKTPRRKGLSFFEDLFFSMFDTTSPCPMEGTTTESTQATLKASASPVEARPPPEESFRFRRPPLEGGLIGQCQDDPSDVKDSPTMPLAVRLLSRREQFIEVIIAGSLGLYSGPTIDGIPNGVGSIRFSNGDIYLGRVMDGKIHGKGTMYTKAGLSRGRFENDVFMG